MFNEQEMKEIIAWTFNKNFQEIFDLIPNPEANFYNHDSEIKLHIRYALVLLEQLDATVLNKLGYLQPGNKLNELTELLNQLKNKLENFQERVDV